MLLGGFAGVEQEKIGGANKATKKIQLGMVIAIDRNDAGATKFAPPITQPSSFGPAGGAIIPALVWGTAA
jgi:hypothetical protein